MALPSSGTIDLLAIQTEFGASGLAASAVDAGLATLNGTDLVPDTSMRDFLGTAAPFIFYSTISTDQVNYNLRSAAIAAGWNGVQALRATIVINVGVYVFASDPFHYAFDTGSSFPARTVLTLNNYGLILGWGGDGGAGGTPYVYGANSGSAGQNGGPALIARSAITINNSQVIGGGSGGGGGGGATLSLSPSFSGDMGGDRDMGGSGGGGGGGTGLGVGAGGYGGGSVFGYPAGESGNQGTSVYYGGAGSGGAGGAGSSSYGLSTRAGSGGNGGSLGGAGSAGTAGSPIDNPYWTRYQGSGGAGGPGGAAVVGNSYITWTATGTRYGSIT